MKKDYASVHSSFSFIHAKVIFFGYFFKARAFHMTPELPGKLATYESRLDAVAEQIHLGGVLADPLVGGVV